MWDSLSGRSVSFPVDNDDLNGSNTRWTQHWLDYEYQARSVATFMCTKRICDDV